MRYIPSLLATLLASATLLAAATLCAAAGPGAADDVGTIASCLKAEHTANHDGRACMGKISDPCLASGSDSTTSMVECVDHEIKIWDDLLNADYQILLKVLPAPAAESVRQAQRNWVALRDADCKVPYDIYEGGTIARIDSVNCVLGRTAERVLQLRIWRQMAQPEEN
jgi:uncharacterized protein YecT (DUF1311 family)